jgi:hypothetical protein
VGVNNRVPDFKTIYDTGVVGTFYTLTDQFGRNVVTGTLASKSAGPPKSLSITVTLANGSATHTYRETKLDSIESGADVTAVSTHRQEAASSALFYCTYTGAVKSGEVTRTIKVTRFKGTTDVSSSATWSVTAANCTATVGADGTVSVTAFTSTGWLAVASTYGGVTLTSTLITIAQLDPAPPPPASGTTITSTQCSTFSLITSISSGSPTTIAPVYR